jgi:hypothetical protein
VNDVKFHPIGAIVKIGPHPQTDAEILAIMIRPGPSVEYQLVWWDDNTRIVEWVTEGELHEPSHKKITVGFRGDG